MAPRVLALKPCRRGLLDLLEELAHGQCARQRARDVDVVRRPADPVSLTANRAASTGKVGVEILGKVRWDAPGPILRAEYNM